MTGAISTYDLFAHPAATIGCFGWRVLKAADSPFVKRLRPFRKSVRQHIAFICRHIPQMEPQLASACEELQAAMLG